MKDKFICKCFDCTVNLQPCNALRTRAQSICSRVMRPAPVRGHFAALQRQIAGMHGENAEMKVNIKRYLYYEYV